MRNRMRPLAVLGWVVWLVAAPAPAFAGGGLANIEEGLPLTIESTYTIAYLGREFQLVSRYERGDEGVDSFLIEPRVELGIWWNTEFKITAPFLFGEIEPDGNRPIQLEFSYNLNQETLELPAFAVAGGFELPTGEDAEGYDPFLKLLVTRTLGRSMMFHQVHLNFLYQWNDQVQADERSGRYELAVGYSRRLGVDTLFVADFVREQEMEQEIEANLVEAGLRYKLLPQGILSGGIGFGTGDESPDVRVTIGFQYEF